MDWAFEEFKIQSRESVTIKKRIVKDIIFCSNSMCKKKRLSQKHLRKSVWAKSKTIWTSKQGFDYAAMTSYILIGIWLKNESSHWLQSLRTSAPSAVIFFTAKCAEKYPQSYAEILSLSITTGMAYGYGLLNLTTLTFETASFFYAWVNIKMLPLILLLPASCE